jgi:hypothetical protein
MMLRPGLEPSMRKLGLVVASLALALPACGPGFASESEELAYLSSLANPSPDQWKRRRELRGKAESADRAERAKALEAAAAVEREMEVRAAAREAARPREMMELADKHRAERKPGLAVVVAKDVMTKYPDSAEAKAVPSFIARCEAENRARYEAEQSAPSASPRK